jgi:hypothetical protein
MAGIDANRAAEVLTDFMERNRAAFGSALSSVVLDLRQERLVDQVCRRLTKDPDQVDLAKEVPMVRALLAARVAIFQSNASADADAIVLENATSTTDEALVAELFRKVLTDAKLPRNWDRKKFSDVQPGEAE